MRSYTVIFPVALMITMGWAGLCSGADAAVKEEGSFPATFLGGGDYVMAKAPSGDSWIAVVYGTGDQTDRSPVTIVAGWTRTLAGGEIHNSAGKLLNRSMPIKVRSILIHQFEALVEFNDTSGDGIGNLVRSPQPVAADQIIAREPVYKAVSLRQAWTRDTVGVATSTENGTTVRTFSFNLTASDLDYSVLGNRSVVNASPGDGKLNRITFGFHLGVFVTRGTVTVPFYNLTVVQDALSTGYEIARLPDRTYNITTYSARTKTDHIIEGWDFDPENTSPRLILETATRLGMGVPPPMDGWINTTYQTNGLLGGGRMNYTVDGGKPASAVSSSDALEPDNKPADPKDTPVKLGSREVAIEDGWQKCGWLAWTSEVKTQENATAPAKTDQAFFEVQGARRFLLYLNRSSSSSDGWFWGVQLLGGLSYPGAWKIVHDPELGADMGNVDIPYFGPPENHAPVACIISPKEGAEFKTTDNIRLDGTACSDSDNDTLSYGWTEGNRTLGFSPIVSRKFAEGKHRLSLTIHDGRGGFDTATVNFTVKKESTPGFLAVAAGPAILCALVIAGAWRRRS